MVVATLLYAIVYDFLHENSPWYAAFATFWPQESSSIFVLPLVALYLFAAMLVIGGIISFVRFVVAALRSLRVSGRGGGSVAPHTIELQHRVA